MPKTVYIAKCTDRVVHRWSNENGEGDYVMSSDYDQTFEAETLDKLLTNIAQNVAWDDKAKPEACEHNWCLDVIEDSRGHPDKNGGFIATYMFRIEKHLVELVTEETASALA